MAAKNAAESRTAAPLNIEEKAAEAEKKTKKKTVKKTDKAEKAAEEINSEALNQEAAAEEAVKKPAKKAAAKKPAAKKTAVKKTAAAKTSQKKAAAKKSATADEESQEAEAKATAPTKTAKIKKPAAKAKEAQPEKEKATKKPTKPKTTKAAKTTKTSAKSRKFSEYEDKTLVVVESPAKAKTLEKILGSDYKVLASVGHVRDLPKGRLAIAVEDNFEPEYIQVRGKADLIKTLKGASAVSSSTLLASDPDREGEAIAWHLANLLSIDPQEKCRIRMHEITEHGVKSAVAEPDVINMDIVEAQQARRVLDRLVGYELSPLLWYKVQRGLSAGRVQSVALRIVCEREDEIEQFIPDEYWIMDVEAAAEEKNRRYRLRVEKFNNRPLTIADKAEAERIEQEISAAPLTVDDFTTKETRKQPGAPFKTSTLQQEASRRCGFAPRRTMRIAQSLYEGVELPGRGPTGLITYMRTDSLRLAPEALESSRDFIKKNFGERYLPEKPNYYTPKERAQDAHEAIRATDASITPESIKDNLTPEQFRLYELIWGRFIASQMTDAVTARTVLSCSAANYQMKQSGVVVTFEGWGKVYPLGIKDVTMEPAIKGEQLVTEKIEKEQKFTQPLPRYSDAGLVRVLEEKGIGRPSTYAAILETLTLRGYVERSEENKKLVPTKLGRLVNKFLVKYFSSIVNEGFTAKMEEELDEVESGGVEWKKLMADFWGGFKPVVEEVAAHGEDMRPEPELIGEKCPECGHDLIIKRGRFGEFIACTGYPECRYTRKIVKSTGIKCPKCGEGELIRRKATKGKMKGRFFYGCNRYPDCDFVAWKKPGTDEKKAEESQQTAGEDNDL